MGHGSVGPQPWLHQGPALRVCSGSNCIVNHIASHRQSSSNANGELRMEHRQSFGSLVYMDGHESRVVNRMPSMGDWAPSGQRVNAASLSPLPLIDGQDVDNLAMGIIIFGQGAWEDIAKLTGNSVGDSQHRDRLFPLHPLCMDAF